MASTNPSDYSLSVALTNVAAMRKRPDFIAGLILPAYAAPKLTGNKIWSIDPNKDVLRIQDDARAPGAPAASIFSGTPTTPISFDVTDHSLADILPDEVRSQYDTAIRAEANKAQKLSDKLLLNYEKECVTLFATCPSGSTPTVKFDDYGSVATTSTGYDPTQYLLSKFATVEAAIGASPNFMALDIATARAIVHNPRVRDYVKQTMPPSALYDGLDSWKAQLASILGLATVFIARSSFVNSAKKGQSASLARMWDDNILLGYQEPSSVEYAGLGLTANFTGEGGGLMNGMSVETGRLARQKSDEIIAHWYRTPVLVNSGAAVWITDTLT